MTRRSRNEFGDRQCVENSAAQRFNEHEIEVARELIYDKRKFEGDICIYDPLTEFTTLFEGKTDQDRSNRIFRIFRSKKS